MAFANRYRNNPNVAVAALLGVVLVLVGVWGFFSEPVLLIFGINALHNWVHLLTGAALLGIAFAAGGRYARVGNLTLGIIYGVVAVLGFANVVLPGLLNYGDDTVANASNWLHALITVVLIATPLLTPTTERRRAPRARAT